MDDALTLTQTEVETRGFINDVYHWMLYGLSLTGGVAWWASNQPALVQALIQNRILLFVLFGVELALVFVLSGWVQRMSTTEAALAYLAYAALNGLTLSFIFLIYTRASIASTFFVTAATFAVMSVYGYVTKTDLTGVGNMCFMGLVGLIIASMVNWFLKSSTIYWITTYAGVLVFVGLTAYDTQKIKQLAVKGLDDPDTERKTAISGALMLYLDFVNLFLNLLRIMGRRRD